MRKSQEKTLEIKGKFAELNRKFVMNNNIKQLDELPTTKDSIISTGILSLDIALGIGGIRRGNIVEIYAPESAGKTTLALHMCKQYQKQGIPILYIDSERTLTRETIERIGIKPDNFYILNVDTLEEALEVCKASASLFGIIVIDSLAGLAPKAQIDGDVGESHVGLYSKIMSSTLPVLMPILADNMCTLIAITQIREKVNIMFGSPEYATGGKALKYYASVRLDVRRRENIRQNWEIIGNRTRVKVAKNKLSTPFKESEFDIMFDHGICVEGDILDQAIEKGVVIKSGALYLYEDKTIGKGKENAKQYLKDNPEICKKIYQQTIKATKTA